jgi:hypothetical protein
MCYYTTPEINTLMKEKKSDRTYPSNDLQFPKEHCCLEGSQASPVCLADDKENGAFVE